MSRGIRCRHCRQVIIGKPSDGPANTTVWVHEETELEQCPGRPDRAEPQLWDHN